MTTTTFRNGKSNGTFRDSDVTPGQMPAGRYIAGPAVPQRSRGESDISGLPQHAETPVMGAGTSAVMPGSTGLQPPGGEYG
jgi:hypothetical protein